MSTFDQNTRSDGYIEKLVSVQRNTKVVKGGRNFSFAATVVVGNGNGKVGIGRGKSKEVPSAIQKALESARKNMVSVPLKDGTLYHPIKEKHGATKLVMLPAKGGTGVIAGGALRAVFEVVGVKNVLSKCIGSSNPVNVVRAALKGLLSVRTPEGIAEKRGKSVTDILGVEAGVETND